MLLEDIGINPASFSEASHVVKIMLGKCGLFVACKSDVEALHIKMVSIKQMRIIS